MECSPTQLKPASRLRLSTNVSIPPQTLVCQTNNPKSNNPIDVAVITGLYLAAYNIGSALGNTISGAIWNQVLPSELNYRLGNETLAAEVYAQPLAFAAVNPVGTPDRDNVILAYQKTQRLLCITGICLTVPLIAFALIIRNPTLTKEQSLAKAEEESSDSDFPPR